MPQPHRTPPQPDSRPIAPIVPPGCARPVSETLPAAVERIARALCPDKIILFGSYAYGTPTPDSDTRARVPSTGKPTSLGLVRRIASSAADETLRSRAGGKPNERDSELSSRVVKISLGLPSQAAL